MLVFLLMFDLNDDLSDDVNDDRTDVFLIGVDGDGLVGGIINNGLILNGLDLNGLVVGDLLLSLVGNMDSDVLGLIGVGILNLLIGLSDLLAGIGLNNGLGLDVIFGLDVLKDDLNKVLDAFAVLLDKKFLPLE